jgi:hypothetical protein
VWSRVSNYNCSPATPILVSTLDPDHGESILTGSVPVVARFMRSALNLAGNSFDSPVNLLLAGLLVGLKGKGLNVLCIYTLWSRITKYICSLRSKSTKCSRPRLVCFLLWEEYKTWLCLSQWPASNADCLLKQKLPDCYLVVFVLSLWSHG